MAPRLERVDQFTCSSMIEQFRSSGMQASWASMVTGLEFWATDGGPLTIGDASGSIHLALFERLHKSADHRCLYRQCEPV